MNTIEWASKWNIPYDAVVDLHHLFGMIDTDPLPQDGESETAIQTRVRLEASKLGMRLWRNNVGAARNAETGAYFRYGLANDSKKLNEELKSSDLIGIRPITIKPEHVGLLIGQFTAREVKHGSWEFAGTDREQAQLRFIKLVISLGGDAMFTNKEGTL